MAQLHRRIGYESREANTLKGVGGNDDRPDQKLENTLRSRIWSSRHVFAASESHSEVVHVKWWSWSWSVTNKCRSRRLLLTLIGRLANRQSVESRLNEYVIADDICKKWLLNVLINTDMSTSVHLTGSRTDILGILHRWLPVTAHTPFSRAMRRTGILSTPIVMNT